MSTFQNPTTGETTTIPIESLPEAQKSFITFGEILQSIWDAQLPNLADLRDKVVAGTLTSTEAILIHQRRLQNDLVDLIQYLLASTQEMGDVDISLFSTKRIQRALWSVQNFTPPGISDEDFKKAMATVPVLTIPNEDWRKNA